MKHKILIPLNRNFGTTHFRMEVPASFFNSNIEVKYHRYSIDKYKALPFEVENSALRKIVGLSWDYAKWFEALILLFKKGSYDSIWLSRSLLNYKNRLDGYIGDIIYDVDDAIWLDEAKFSFKWFCERAKVIFAGNEYLATHARKYSQHVEVVPTSINVDVYKKLPINNIDYFTIGWIGSSSGFKNLLIIEASLVTFFENHRNSQLTIVADRFPKELSRLYKYINFVKWSIDADVQMINTFNVGIMPLEDSSWSRGKCSFKLLQYMACEVPVIASPVGMNKDVLSFSAKYGAFGREAVGKDDWIDKLSYYYFLSNDGRMKEGKNGRGVIINEFAASMISEQIAKHIEKYS